ncbi:MAG: pitrilysin family protein, partial [Candidatus Omnitrophota bacterium]|nr:pitrilysin family protein [Candidatus Omnitrophota bacterium]
MDKVTIRAMSANLALLFLFCLSPRVCSGQAIYTAENTLKRELGNGLAVVIHEIHKAPIVSVDIIVKTGSANEANFFGSGISHLTEHMLFKGTLGKNNIDIEKYIKSLGGRINAFTSYDYTGYTVTVPSEHIVDALKALKDFVFFPSFDALELKKEIEVILDEIRRNRDNPARFALELSWPLAFREHPYKYPVIGYDDLFAGITKKDLEEYFSRKYSPHNMALVVSGDVDKAGLFEDIKEIFCEVKRKLLSSVPNIPEPPQSSRRRRVEYKPVKLSHTLMSYKSASINDDALYPLDLLSIVLGDGEDSVFTKELRDKKGLVYSINCGNYTLRDSGLFHIYFISDSSKVNDAIAAILRELEKVKENGVNSKDLKKAKKIARAGFIRALETAAGRTRDMSISEALTGNYDFSQDYLNRLDDVTGSRIKSAAKQYLGVDSLNTVILMPEEEEKITAAAEEKNEILQDNPSGPRGRTVKEVMPNGMKILVSEDHSTPICAISALFPGGVRAEDKTNNGVSHLVSRLVLDGTAQREEKEIKSIIESEGGRIQSISGNNSVGIILHVLSDNWKTGVELLGDMVMNSLFSGDKIEKEKSLALAAIKERDDNIIKSGLLLFKNNLFGGHPYRFDTLGTEKTIRNLKREDILNYYESFFVPDNMIITGAGDINAGDFTREVKKQFGKFEQAGLNLPEPPVYEKLTGKKEASAFMKREQSIVIVGFSGAKFTDSERYIFEVINSIMSGSDGRLFHNIRDKSGIGYSLGSSFMPGIEPGYHIFYAVTSRKNIETARDAIIEEV